MPTIHGYRRERIYSIWTAMKSRCNNKNNKRYKRYGGRGIKVYPKWDTSPMSFIIWAKANGYSDEMTIERIDVNGNYEPNNCTFILMSMQARNRTNNTLITYRHKTQTMAAWAEETGISPKTLSTRLNRGWHISRLFEQPRKSWW
jgi:hypothetical protein